MRRIKTIFFLSFVAVLLFLLFTFHFAPPTCLSSNIVAYYPSSYNLIGSTTYVSGSLTDLQSNDSVCMTFRSYGSANSTLHPITNMNFTTSSEGWITTFTNTSGLASYGFDSSEGNLLGSNAGSYFHRANLTTTFANISFITETSFNYTHGIPISVSLSYAYGLSGDSFGNGSSLIIRLMKPDNTTVDLCHTLLPAMPINWTYITGIAINTSHFSQSGTYKLQFISNLISNATGTYIQLNFDDIGISITYYNEYTAEVEFIGSSNTREWAWITWTVVTAWTVENVSVTLQLYNYTLGDYPVAGNGYICYVSSSTPDINEMKSQNITVNSEDFRDDSGNWKIKIKGVKSTSSQFELKVDFVEFKLEYINLPPVALFTASADTVYTNETITFNASESYDPDGSIVSYFWDFGDGSNGTGMVVDHSYADDGNYTVVLTVTDNEGETNSTSTIITVLNRAPFANFTYSPDSPTVNEVVTFNASESYDLDGYIANYTWDFGDGNVTTTTNPIITHTYSSYGNYTVTLNVTDDDEATSTATKSIRVKEYPVASFVYSPESPAVNQTVMFNATESYDVDGHIVSYVWNFGDGNITTVTNPIIYHKYTSTGNYTVKLVVTDNDGLTDTASQSITVRNPPVANFTYTPQYPYVGDTVTFNATSSSSDNATIVSYLWDFGDGSPKVNETDPITTHIYEKAGNFTVTLTIRDSDGLEATTTKTIEVLKAPIAAFTYSPVSPKAYDQITFNASESYDPNGYIVSYVWDFGDGNVTTVDEPIITHYYTQAGNYTVVLIVSDNEGYTDSTSKVVTVSPRPPVADFNYSPEFPIVDEVITFNASESYDLDGYIANYTWDFGDGNITTTTNPIITHTYSSYGNYTVILTVTDNDNLSSSKTYTLRVREYPTAVFTVTPEIIAVNDTATFNASMSAPNGGTIIWYFWDFGDGSSLNTTKPIVTHVYATIGNYTVMLTVKDDEELEDTTSKIIQVSEKPIAKFTYSPSDPYVGDSITFNATESYDPDGTVVSYTWDFGDGNVTITTNPIITHIYDTGGNYTVVLTVVDNLGLRNSTSLLIGINKAPVASFTYTPNNPIVGEIVTFNASESYDIRRPIANYTWDFGDGNVTTTTNPIITHTYSSYGNYTVTLIVVDTGGYNDTCTKTISIRDYPIADFTLSPTYPIKDEATTFNASSSQPNGGTIIWYFWDFGDGSSLNTTEPIVNHTFKAIGEYNVTLTVIDSEGLSNTTIKTIKVRDYPTASFTWEPRSPLSTEPVTFNASTSKANSGTITAYVWDFGDGNVTTTTNPIIVHVYSIRGNYTVTLTVENSEGLSNTTSKIITVQACPPTANFTWIPQIPLRGEPVTFNASTSQPNGGNITAYVWDFGDGNTTETTDPIIVHVFGTAGNYTVTLTVIDSERSNSSKSHVIEVGIAPVAYFDHSPPQPYVWDTVIFNASKSYDPDGYIANYTWDFGDGNVTTTTNPIITHKYSEGAEYVIQLTVTDNKGHSNQTSILLTIEDYPTADFNWSPNSPIAGETVTFNASLSSPNGGTIEYYVWDFGDGTQANVTNPIITHTYKHYGEYSVILTVVDSYGLSNNVTKTITVRDYPTATFEYSPTLPQRNVPLTFNASLSKPNGGHIINYIWDFGDGNITSTTDPIITHTYYETGSYTVTLTVTDSEGLNASYSKSFLVVNAYPVASFFIVPENPIANETATFNASESYDPDGYIVSYIWDFGDGTKITTTSPVAYHTYDSIGTYNVSLTVKDNEDFETLLIKQIKVIFYPTANFTWSPYPYVRVSEPVTFNASLSLPGSGNITAYIWDFGDGNITSTTDPIITHTYYETGSYTVTLTVINSDGLSANLTKRVDVYGDPYANFTWHPTIPITQEETTFNASSSEANGGFIISYIWDFGDGSPLLETTSPIVTHTYTIYGTFNVTLKVENNAGFTGEITKQVTVLSKPTPIFTIAPKQPYEYDIVTFNASLSLPGSGNITAYIWDFGDGNITSTTDPIITHTYAVNGSYTVTLNVTNSDGLSAIVSKQIEISPAQPPVVKFDYYPEKPGVYGEIIFNASNSEARGGSIVSYIWDFGDGNITEVKDPTIIHIYQQPGNYTVKLNATNLAGYYNYTIKIVEVVPISDPTAEFTWFPDCPRTNRTITFNASESMPGWNGTTYPPIQSYIWDFGDGNITTVSDPIITHVYVAEANYTVTLTVIDADGRNGTVTYIIEVKATPVYDINGDGKINIRDVAIVAYSYGSYPGHPRWNPDADITGPNGEPDGKVDIRDVALVAAHFGEILESTMFKPLKSPYSSFLLHVIILTILYSVALTAAQVTLLIRKPIKGSSKYLSRRDLRNHAAKTIVPRSYFPLF